MRRRFSTTDILIFALIAVGIFINLFANPGSFMIPVFVLGGVFLLYKFLPRSRVRKMSPSYVSAKQPRRKTNPFRVIPGKKGTSDDETHTHKYH